ncbi:MAG: CPBP family intramembrane metalloprotease [Nonlabens sp.]|nr:CPBP family intramembrane metalloprotease [Nonlabens sp.]
MFIERANNAQNEAWRWLIGFVVIFLGCQFIGGIPFIVAVALKLFQEGNMAAMQDEATLMTTYSSNITFFLMMIIFIIGMIFWRLWTKYVHKLSWTEATTSRAKFDWSRAGLAFMVVGTVSVITTVIGYYGAPEDYVWNFNAEKFAVLCVIAVLLVPIQTTWEELFFRSYMMQGLGLMSGNRAVPFIITSVVFGGMHVFNPEIAKMGYIVMVWYIGTGFLLGIFTLMDEGIELAVGFHAANNLIIALLVTSDWTAFQTESILKDVSDPAVDVITMLPILGYYALLVLLFAKIYKWKNWKEKLFGKVEVPFTEPHNFSVNEKNEF